MKLSGAVRQLANHCQVKSIDGCVITLVLDETASHLQTGALQEKFRQALCDGFGREVRIRMELGRPEAETPAQKMSRKDAERQHAAEASIDKDPNVLALEKAFDATVDPASIKPASH
jgi:DNA polymerase-3 subunit gamma/tau